jgi:ribonuclease R
MPLAPRPLVSGYTVDPPDARDLDDAIDVRKHAGGWRLCISIADVAEHLPAGSDADQQAYHRGFSRYFADHHDPMLPRELAEERLSLLGGQGRDTLTFSIDLDTAFDVTAIDIQKTRLQSRAQLTYDQVSEVLDAPHHTDYPYWRDALDLAYGLFRKRQGHGALALFDPLSGWGSTEEGRLVRLPEGARHRPYLIVQELMILVNHAITRHLAAQGLPLLFRNHTRRQAEEDDASLSDLQAFRLDPSPTRLERLQPHLGHLFNRACYHPLNQGHVGLGLACYTHWTSPIRRYSDLVNHRQLRAWLDGEPPPYGHEVLVAIGAHLAEASDQARQAQLAAQDQACLTLLNRADAADLAALTPKTISRLAESLAAGDLELSEPRLAELQCRLQDDALTPADLMRLLLAPAADGPWPALKAAVLTWLRQHPAEVLQVFHAAHQVYSWPPLNGLDWRESQIGPAHNPIFCAQVGMTDGSRQVTSQAARSATRRGARQGALLSLLGRLVGVDVPLPADTVPAPIETPAPPEPPPHLEIDNPKGLLLEIAQRQQTAAPTFDLTSDGPSHLRQYICVASIDLDGRCYRSAPSLALSKKEAERASALNLLAQLPPALLEKPPRRDLPIDITPGKHPVSLLQEWTSRQLDKQPHYAFERSGPPHAPLFICTCQIDTAQAVKQWQGTGATKKAAKTEAARTACRSLLGQII